MPLTIITLKNSTPSLRGDLSKWMQEIATGVYIGNFNSRIREFLWDRVVESVGNGEATISYANKNEIGYNFKTHNTKRIVVDSDGIPIVKFPNDNNDCCQNSLGVGFSNASKYHSQRKFANTQNSDKFKKENPDYVILDIETDGLDVNKNNIIEVAAIKCSDNTCIEFQKLIKISRELPDLIVSLTGITNAMIEKEGESLEDVLDDLSIFIGNNTIVGYNIKFDMKFINSKMAEFGKRTITNRTIDLMILSKKENMYLPNYKLETVLNSYGIKTKMKHRALEDAKNTYKLANKLNKFKSFLKR